MVTRAGPCLVCECMFFANRVPPKARDVYKKDATAGMLIAIMSGMTGPFVAVIARKTLHANAFEIGVLSMAPIAGNLLSLLWANIMEGRPKMPFAKWSWILARSMFFFAIWATTSLWLVAIVAAMSFVASVAAPAYSALMKEVYPDQDRARIMGYVRVCTVAVFVVVTAVTAPLLHGDNYRFIFPVAALFGVASALVFARIPTADAAGDSGVRLGKFIRDGIMILRDDRAFRWFCGGIFVSGFANLLAQPIYVIYQVNIGVDTIWAGAYSVTAASVMTVAYFYWGSYTDRKGPQAVVVLQTLCSAAVPLIYCIAARPWMLLPTAVVGGIVGAGMELSYFNGVLHFAPRERITHYQGLFLSLMGLRGLVAPFIGAALHQSKILPMKGVFLVSAALMILAVVIQLVGMRKYAGMKESDDGAQL